MSRKSGSSRTQREVRAVELDGVEKSYGDVVAFRADALEVAIGESVVLVGHNGSGKSTLLGMLAGTIEPTEGRIRLHGAPHDSIASRTRRSWLPDTPVLYDDLSVREHLEFTARMHGGSGQEPLLDELVDRLGLAHRVDDLPSQFSRGLRQKAAAAVALCRPFSLLLVDEPFVGLDATGRIALLELLDEAHDSGATVIVATHDPVVLERFDRGLVLADGEIIHDGPTGGLAAFLTSLPQPDRAAEQPDDEETE